MIPILEAAAAHENSLPYDQANTFEQALFRRRDATKRPN